MAGPAGDALSLELQPRVALGEFGKTSAPDASPEKQRGIGEKVAVPGTFLPGDEVPEALLPILRRMMREQLPVLADAGRRLDVWAAGQQPGAPVPRALGMHRFAPGNATGERAIMTFSLWMLQRPLDFHRSLTGADRLLAEIGAGEFTGFSMKSCLARRDFRLMRA